MLINNQPASSVGHAGSKLMPSSSSSGPRMPAIVGKLNIMLHVAAVLVSLSLAFMLFDSSLFGWHPLFMSLGFLLFMSEGLIAGVMFRHLDGPERVRAIWAHALMQARALVCILIGFAVIYQNKVLHNKQHFKTRHAQFGLATLLLAVGAPLLGLISFKRLGIIQKFPEPWHPRLKWLHRRIGVVTWLLALVTIELALPHPAVHRAVLTPLWRGGVAVIGVLMLLLLRVAQVKLKTEQEERSQAKFV